MNIIIIHKNDADFIHKLIKVNSSYNNINIHFLGDYGNKHIDKLNKNIKFDYIDKYHSNEIDIFKKNYIHDNVNNYKYELFCFTRFFYLYNYCNKNNIENFLYLDSDILLLDNISKYIDNVSVDVQVLCNSSTWFSYWSSNGLKKFCKFCIDIYTSYKDEYSSQFTNRFCDMNALNIAIKKNILTYKNIQHNFEGIEENKMPSKGFNFYLQNLKQINFDQLYNKDIEDIIKIINEDIIIWKNGIPFYKNKKFIFIHFQGASKRLINYFVRNYINKSNTNNNYVI